MQERPILDPVLECYCSGAVRSGKYSTCFLEAVGFQQGWAEDVKQCDASKSFIVFFVLWNYVACIIFGSYVDNMIYEAPQIWSNLLFFLPHFLSQPPSLILPLANYELCDWLTDVVTCHWDTLYVGAVSVALGRWWLVLFKYNFVG